MAKNRNTTAFASVAMFAGLGFIGYWIYKKSMPQGITISGIGRCGVVRPEFNRIREPHRFFNIPNTQYISHGDWADPELWYDNYELPYWDFIDYLFDEMEFDTGIKNAEYEDVFEWFSKKDLINKKRLLDNFVYQLYYNK